MVSFAAPFIDNREPRCPCVLVLDTSGSMRGKPIDNLNSALRSSPFKLANALSNKRCEIALVTFGPVKTICDFTEPHAFDPPPLAANGDTPLGAAVMHALNVLDERVSHYKRYDLRQFEPWLFLVTDGTPNEGDPWKEAAAECREREAVRQLQMWSVAVPGDYVKMDVLKAFSAKRPPAMLADNRFQDLLDWVAKSINVVSRSRRHDGPGGDMSDPVDLEPPTSWMKL